MAMRPCDVAIIGAGPYGLSAAAHLRTVKGLEVRVFGEPMSFWDRNMPVGMFLRSGWSATHLAHPNGALTLEEYQAATGSQFTRPVPLHHFVQYGQWFQRQAIPDLERRKIVRLESDAKGFRLKAEDGETIHAKRAIIAVGIGAFARRPAEFRELPCSLASHASEHSDLRVFAGKRVAVIGSGQSALESAALLHEGGAEVEVLGRAHRIQWLQGFASTALHYRMGKFTKALLYAPTDVGPAGISQLMARPDLLRMLPRSFQNKLWKRAIRPAGSRWLVDRLKDVPIRLGRSVVSACSVGEEAKLKLDDGSERSVDHVLMGTGYRVDISKYGFLSPKLAESIQCVNGYPYLQPGLETSVPGLHILGAPGAWSFGPLMQFVSGTHYASRSLMRCITGKNGTANGHS
jgi:cation diffusion facilitator CzcD-associated flavoprotein CzcO